MSLRLISQRSNRRSASFLAVGGIRHSVREGNTAASQVDFTRAAAGHAAVTGIFNHASLRTRHCIVLARVRGGVSAESFEDRVRRSVLVRVLDRNVLTDSEKYYVNTCLWDPTWYHGDAAQIHHSRLIFTMLSLLGTLFTVF